MLANEVLYHTGRMERHAQHTDAAAKSESRDADVEEELAYGYLRKNTRRAAEGSKDEANSKD